MSHELHRIVSIATLGALLAATPGSAQDPARPQTTPSARADAAVEGRPSPADEAFVRTAVAGGNVEVEMAALAMQRASANAVKELARRIDADHKKADAELTSIATEKNISVDPKPTAEHEKEQARVAKLSGSQFDRAYLEMMAKDHQKAIQEFERQANAGSDPALKAFAAKTLPDLKEHLRMTLDVQKVMRFSRRD